MQNLINYILQFGNLNIQQIELVKNSLTTLKLKKGEYFSEAAKIADRVGFVNKGILRVCHYTKDGDEITRYFIDENNFVVDLDSFQNQIPSSDYVQAITPIELYIFSRANLQNLSNTIIGWDSIISKISSKALIEKVNRISPMLSEDAKTRYLEFFKRFPNLANRIPINYLASYIGITKHSLSRIRKEIVQEKS